MNLFRSFKPEHVWETADVHTGFW